MSRIATGSRKVLTTSCGAVGYWDEGVAQAGPPLIFLQGLLAGPDAWLETVGALAPRHRCVRVDWPFGAHQVPLNRDADLSPPGIARLVGEVLDILGAPEAVLIGNDSGGVIAQLVIANEPRRVASAVLASCDAFECFPPGVYRHLFRLARIPGVVRGMLLALSNPAIARSPLGLGAVIGVNPDRFHHWTEPARLDAGVRRDLIKLMSSSSSDQTLAAAQQFSNFAKPVLVAWAGNDRLFAPQLGERLAAAFPQGRFVSVPASRTFIPCDQPHALVRLIETHTRKVA